MARTLPPYNQLENLDDVATRNFSFEHPQKLKDELKQFKELAYDKYKKAKKERLVILCLQLISMLKQQDEMSEGDMNYCLAYSSQRLEKIAS